MYVFVNDAGEPKHPDPNVQSHFYCGCQYPLPMICRKKENQISHKLKCLRTEHPLNFRTIHIQADFWQYPTFWMSSCSCPKSTSLACGYLRSSSSLCLAAGNAPFLHKNQQFTFSEVKQSKEVIISMTCDHVFLFKGVKKAKILLSRCWIMFFLLASSQVASISNTYEQHQLTRITCCKDTVTPYVDFCVATATPTAPREATQPATCVFKPAPSQNDSSGHYTLVPDPTSCKLYLSTENLNLPSEVYDHRRQKFEQTWSKIFACIGQEQGYLGTLAYHS